MSRPPFKSSPVITRYAGNPVLSPKDVPYPSGQVFNAGVTKWQGRYVMVFRNDWDYDERSHHPRRRNLGLARSDDGVHWEVAPEPLPPIEAGGRLTAYDPRLTVLDGRLYMCVAVDTPHGIRGGVAVTDDLEHFEVLSLSAPDNRNMVLFPERQDGLLHAPGAAVPDLRPRRAARRSTCGSRARRTAATGATRSWCSAPSRCRSRTANRPGRAARPDRRGLADGLPRRLQGRLSRAGELARRLAQGLHGGRAAAGPRTSRGASSACAGEPLLAPEEAYAYEMDGFRGSVIFPCGLIVEDDGEAKLYYGAADTVVALATAKVEDLIGLCEPVLMGRPRRKARARLNGSHRLHGLH